MPAEEVKRGKKTPMKMQMQRYICLVVMVCPKSFPSLDFS